MPSLSKIIKSLPEIFMSVIETEGLKRDSVTYRHYNGTVYNESTGVNDVAYVDIPITGTMILYHSEKSILALAGMESKIHSGDSVYVFFPEQIDFAVMGMKDVIRDAGKDLRVKNISKVFNVLALITVEGGAL